MHRALLTQLLQVPVTCHSHSVTFTDLSLSPRHPATPPLETITLAFRFATSKVDSEALAASSFSTDELVDKVLDPFTLHFSLQSLVRNGLESVFEKLVQAFPLCLNAAFVQVRSKRP